MNTNFAITVKKHAAVLVLAIAMLFSFAAKAQLNAVFTTSLLTDSLEASNNKDFLYNNLTINNTSSDKLNLTVTITTPGKWQLVTDNVATVTLDRNGSTIIPIRVLPGNASGNDWQAVRIQVRNNNTAEVKNLTYAVKVKPFTKFKATLMNPSLIMPGYQRLISIPVSVKNTGNTQIQYAIAFKNEFLHLDEKAEITLDANTDTTYNIPLSIREGEYNSLKKEDVLITVTANGETINLVQSISKIGSLLKDHTSAYADMPLQLEAGAIYQGQGSKPQYFGGIYGSVDIDNNNRVSMSLRTGMFTNKLPLNDNLVKLDYTGTHVQVSLGTLMEVSDFPMNGYGAKAGYNWGKDNRNKIVLYGELKSAAGNDHVYGGYFQHLMGKNVKITESVATDENKDTKLNAAVVKQTIDAQLGSNAKLSVITGASMEQTTTKMANNASNEQAGTSLGYNFNYSTKHLSLLSNMLYNSNSFAGIYKGQQIQTQDARVLMGKFFVGGYYEYNYNKQNNFMDSLLVSNFNLRTQNYGARIGLNTKGFSAILSAGNQTQQESGADNNFVTNYKYLNLSTTVYFTKKIYINANSYAGYGSVAEKNVNNVFISSTQGTLQVYNGGIAFRYDKGPFYYSDFATYIKTPANIERIVFSPFVDVALFKTAFTARAQYNYMQTSPNTTTNSSVLLNLGYNNAQKGYDFHLTGMLPTTKTQTTNQTYVSATMRVRINAPCVAVRKYHTIKLILFKDVNGNEIFDAGEQPIAGQTVSINGTLFTSDENGVITYKNVADGMYKADFRYSSKIKGWGPAGAVQEIEVDGKNNTQYIAFRKSRVLQGTLHVNNDNNSNLKFSPNNIKVIVTTSDSTAYSTLTDEEGNFYFNLPAGNYTVSLSPVAFDEHFRPTEFAQTADLVNNEEKSVYFEIKQKRREIHIAGR